MTDKSMQGHSYEDVQKIVDFLLSKTEYRPTVGVICGSGLGGLVNNIKEAFSIDYSAIPNFPLSTVAGHAGKLVFGKLSGQVIVCLQGRFHFYEGHSMHKCTLPVRVMASLGIKSIVVTNAAGGVNRNFNVGDIMIIKDHIGFPLMAGINPLIGLNEEKFGPRFPSMTDVYDKEFQLKAIAISKKLGYGDFTQNGVYCMLSGPNYESQAELRVVQTVGGDAVGMSTVPEVVVAKHMGLKVLGISLVTNYCIMDYDTNQAPNHAEVLEVGKKRSECILNIVTKFIEEM